MHVPDDPMRDDDDNDEPTTPPRLNAWLGVLDSTRISRRGSRRLSSRRSGLGPRR